MSSLRTLRSFLSTCTGSPPWSLASNRSENSFPLSMFPPLNALLALRPFSVPKFHFRPAELLRVSWPVTFELPKIRIRETWHVRMVLNGHRDGQPTDQGVDRPTRHWCYR